MELYIPRHSILNCKQLHEVTSPAEKELERTLKLPKHFLSGLRKSTFAF